MWIYGAGGHGKVVATLFSAEHIIDDARPDLPWKDEYIREHGVVAIGDNRTRQRVVQRLLKIGACFVQGHMWHLDNMLGEMGEGCVVMRGAVVQVGTIMGNHVIVNTNATVDHDCRIGDFAHVAPGAVLCGNVEVGEGALIGAGAVLCPGVKVPPWTLVKAGTRVPE